MDSLPVLMDEEFLRDAVLTQYPRPFRKGVNISKVPELRLESKKILKIDLLSEFTSLAKLDLHNNLIEKIQGLNCLVNLKWLNLSFNRIKKIEGLESLQKLEVLDLSNNRISLIENMDALENLTHFLVTNNFISQLDNVLYLRRFKKLVNMYLTGNPVSEENEYIMFIAAFLPNLKGLDEIPFDKKIKDEASAKYKSIQEKMKQEELQKQQADAAQIRKEAELKLHKDAFVESLNGPYLFKSMLEDDPEAATLTLSIPGITSLLQTFEDQMVELCMSLFDTGMAEHKRRETELNSFFSGQNDTETYYKQETTQILEEFDEQHSERKTKLKQLTEPDLIKVEISHCNDEIDQLTKSLMTLEFRVIGNLEINIKILDTYISDMVDDFCKTAQGIFDQCQDLENNYHHKVEEIAVATLQKVAQGNLDEDMPDDLITLFKDENAVMNALAASHDNHLLKISDRANQLLTGVTCWKVALIKEIGEKEVIRHRTRLSDILRYGDYLKENLRTCNSIQ